MPLDRPSPASTCRLENTSARVRNLRHRLDGLRDRQHLSPCLRDDLAAIGRLLDSIDRAVDEARRRVDTLTQSGDGISLQAKQVGDELVADQDPWINYADSRLDAANIAYLALGRTRAAA